jgi:membrane protein DedA with SNARE-associated domain
VIDTLSALIWLFAVVAFGAVVLVVPTGAAVSAAAALAAHNEPVTVLLVVVAGGAGAYLGDAVMYAMCRVGGEQLARRLRWMRDEQRLAAVQQRLRESEVPVLLVSRLIPGGRVPVLLAAGFLGLSWRTFIAANGPACLLWAAVYASIGVLGGSVFPEPWQGVLAAVVLVVVITQGLSWVIRRQDA